MKIRFTRSTLIVLPALLLAACGGGGGGGGGSSTPVAAQVVITSGNQQAVAAEAVQATTNTQTASVGSSFVTGVNVDAAGGDASANGVQLAGAARKLLTMLPASSALATGVTQTATVQCTTGSLSVSATVANPNSSVLQTNDSVSITANACSETVNGASETLNGTMSITVVKGPYDPNSTVYPKSVELKIVAQKFSLAVNGTTTVSNGDLDINVVENSASSESLTLNATELSTTMTASGGSRTVTLKNYFHKIDASSTGAVVQMHATVETNNSRIGSGLLTYDVSTPTSLQLDATGVPTAGSIKVVGKNSAALLTVNTSTSYTLQLDANGDGTYESSTAVTRAQLLALL